MSLTPSPYAFLTNVWIQSFFQNFADTFLYPSLRSQAMDIAAAWVNETYIYAPNYVEANLPYEAAAFVHIISHVEPYSGEVFNPLTYNGDRVRWTIENYFRFKNILDAYADTIPEPDDPANDGESAYEIAVRNGFDGTEQEWLDSLKGPPGDGGTSFLTRIASGTLGGHRLVRTVGDNLVAYAANDNPNHGDDTIGFTINAAVDGAELTLQTTGSLQFSGWNWTPQMPVYLGRNGLPTQVEPDPDDGDAFAQVVGHAEDTDVIFIKIESPIYF